MPLLPSFRRNKRSDPEKKLSNDSSRDDFATLSNSQIKRATRTRRIWCIITALCLFIAVIFLIMTEIGNTYNKPVLRDLYFITLDFTNVIPNTIPDATLLNSVAETLGLHDFYQVGLWNYCEGYMSEGVTQCTKPEALYYFDPVDILVNQLLAGASIQLPQEITQVLDIIKVASHWMFGLFLTGACLSFVLIPIVLLSVVSRWITLLIMILTLLNALFVIVASILATAIFVIMQEVFRNNSDVNIGADIGTKMFAMFWVAAAFTLFAFVIQLCLTCCCASRRDVKKGKKRGSKKAYA